MDDYLSIVELWLSFSLESAVEIDQRLHNFRILFAYNSGKIENDEITYHDTREVFENGRILGYSGTPRTIFELANQRMCYELLLPMLADKELISVALVKEVHAVLTSGTYDQRRYVELGERPGEFKRHDFVVGQSEVVSMPDEVESDVAALLSELVDFHEDSSGDALLTAAAYFHARFEHIHPFADGNGRVGRTLLNYFLMINNHPPLIVYDEDKSLYYAALAAYDVSEDIIPMFEFLRMQTVKTWTTTLERELR
ncbi:MAG: Fic family protein [Oscillospiraceae bacterium]|nr:Fic family protein [Oscillospiraceae bacterium]